MDFHTANTATEQLFAVTLTETNPSEIWDAVAPCGSLAARKMIDEPTTCDVNNM
jgi:hypothetical protein